MAGSRIRAVSVPLLGILAGLTALAGDQALAAATLGAAIPLHPGFVVAYTVSGAVAAVLLAALASLRRGAVPTPAQLYAVSLVVIYAVPLAERVYDLGLGVFGRGLGMALTIVSLMLYLLVVAILARVARSLSAAAVLTALAVAIGLAVNRNVVEQPFATAALAADLAVAVGILALAYLVGAVGAIRTLGLGALLAAGVAAIATLAHAQTQSAQGRRGAPHPHVLLIVVDTLRADVFTDVVASTPEGRQLRRALDGAAWFDDAVAVAPWTAPSVATLLTGLYPEEHGFGLKRSGDRSRPLERLASSVSTLAEAFDAAGYHAEALVTNPLLHPVSGLDRGFDHYELLAGPTSKLPLLTALAEVGLVDGIYYQRAASIRRRFAGRLETLSDRGVPLFFWLHFLDPHRPLLPHPTLPRDAAEDALPTSERLYRREVRYVSAEIAQCIELLRAHRLWDQTVVVLVADHGEMFPSDGHSSGAGHAAGELPKVDGHGHALYDELVRVPLVVRPQGGLESTRRVQATVSQVDLYSSLLDLAGIDRDASAATPRSFAAMLAPDPLRSERLDPVLIGATQYLPRQRALRSGRWKLITFLGTDDRSPELYDLANDRRERHDLSDRQPAQVLRLERQLSRMTSRLKPVAESDAVAADEETRRRLRALGYLQE